MRTRIQFQLSTVVGVVGIATLGVVTFFSEHSLSQSGEPAANPFVVQMPAQGGMPTGVVPPTQGAPVLGQGSPTQFLPMTLPPSSGGFIPVLPVPSVGLGSGSQGVPNTYNTAPPAPTAPVAPIQSELIPVKSDTNYKKPIFVVKTSEGEFKIQLEPIINRHNVGRFMNLVQGLMEFVDVRTGKNVRRPFYTGLNCHRVLKGVLIQCGCPFGTGRGGPGTMIQNDDNNGLRFDKPGIVGMSLQTNERTGVWNDVRDSAGSQFFITLAPMPDFDGKFSILGEISSGMDTIRKIASTPTGPTDRPIKKVIIFSIDPDLPPSIQMAPAPSTPADPMANPIDGPGTMPPPAPSIGIDPFAQPPTSM